MTAPAPKHANRGTRRRTGGFTIIEVMMAASVMALAIASSITVISQGMRAIDTARNTTIAGQVLQSVMEDERLKTYTQVCADEAAGNNGVAGNIDIATTFPGMDAAALSVLSRFTVTRTISDLAGQTGIKRIVLAAAWTGVDGRVHSVNYTSYYAQNGLYAYYIS